MNQRSRQALVDLLDHAAAATRLVDRGKAAEDLIIRLGEAAGRAQRADSASAAAHPELELRQLSYARNVLAHGYDIVDASVVWAILSGHIPRVAASVTAYLRSCSDGAGSE